METFRSFTGDEVTYPHVHLCFDDHSISNWYMLRKPLKERNVKAVFYVDSFEELTDEDLKMLEDLRSDGHVIGCHSHTHQDAMEYSKAFTIDQYIDDEVIPAMEAMAAAGFAPTHFAFPYSHFDDVLYEAVSELFCYVRPGNESHYYVNGRMFVQPERYDKEHPTHEHSIRNGNLKGVLGDIMNQLNEGRGISIVFHDVRSIGSKKHAGTHASDTGFVTIPEVMAVLDAINTIPNVQYQTFQNVCEQGPDPFDKPRAVV
jgi:hypothetical protein